MAALQLMPGRPFDVTGRHFIPDGESFHLKQMALAQPAKKGMHAIISMRTEKHPADLVLGILGPGREQVAQCLELRQDHEAVLSVVGSCPVDCVGFFGLNGEPYNDWGPDSTDDEEEEEEIPGPAKQPMPKATARRRREAVVTQAPRHQKAARVVSSKQEDAGDREMARKEEMEAAAGATRGSAKGADETSAALKHARARQEQMANVAAGTAHEIDKGANESVEALTDMHLTCKDCRQPFIFTILEQHAFLRYGYSIPRIRCKPCSEAKKLGNYDKTGKGAVAGAGSRAGMGSGGSKGYASAKEKGSQWDGGRAGQGSGNINHDGGHDGGMGRGRGGKGDGIARGGNGGGKGWEHGKGIGRSGSSNRAAVDGDKRLDSRKCFAFQQGTCSRGSACKFMHESM